jgi:hypothetical protein
VAVHVELTLDRPGHGTLGDVRGAPIDARFDESPVPEDDRPMSDNGSVGAEFARALAQKDFARVKDLLHPEINFRGLTPNRSWEATDSDSAIAGILRQWFEDDDEIEGLTHVETDSFSDRERVGYRFNIRNPDGEFVVEQQAYLHAEDGRIDWMRVVCSGYRPR